MRYTEGMDVCLNLYLKKKQYCIIAKNPAQLLLPLLNN